LLGGGVNCTRSFPANVDGVVNDVGEGGANKVRNSIGVRVVPVVAAARGIDMFSFDVQVKSLSNEDKVVSRGEHTWDQTRHCWRSRTESARLWWSSCRES
jgi:hypothetical protein